jgi:two-component sensor histidine kinase
VRPEPYLVTFTATANSCKTNDIVEKTIEIYMVLPPENLPTFELPAPGLELEHFVGAEVIDFPVFGSDPNPYDTLTVSAVSSAFESPGNPASFPAATANGGVLSYFNWDPSCQDISSDSYLVTFEVNSRSCQKNVSVFLDVEILITTPTKGDIRPIPNVFTPNRDGLNDAWTIEHKNDFCLQNFNTVVFVVFKIRSNRKLTAEKAKTERLLRDRETLLREIHHRVKNNLQVVSSLLSIQGRELAEGDAKTAVIEGRNRVQSMALIHQFLYGEHNLSSINMTHYVTELSRRLLSAYSIDPDQVELHVEVDNIMLDVDTAIPLGLIINELITNSLKHAFPEKCEGNLWVSLKDQGGVLTLQVRDDGVGIGHAKKSASAFGMTLLNAFKQKLDGQYDIFPDPGFKVEYRVRNYKIKDEAQ